MKARVIYDGPFWYGEIFGMDEFGIKNNKWNMVTMPSYIKLGASYALKRWIHKNIPDEFEV